MARLSVKTAAAAAVAAGAAAYALLKYARRHRGTEVDGRIDDVLAFWFGSRERDVDVLQRSLWFARGSARDAADRAVGARFGGLADAALRGDLDGWVATPRGAVALVVVLDQLARHERRGDGPFCDACSAAAVRVFDGAFGDRGRWDAARELSPARHVFAWMCLRHTRAAASPDALRDLLRRVEARAAKDRLEQGTLDRFRRASAKRLREASASKKAAVADAWGAFDDEALLERPYAPCAPGALSTALAGAAGQTLRRFVADECARRGYRSEFVEGGDRFRRRGRPLPLCVVSLSGGVDSMVLCFLLARLRDELVCGSDQSFAVKAVHVDYGNRPESRAEAAFLRKWCDSEGVDLEVLVMPEALRRSSCDREVYEREARDRRFAFYREHASRRPVLLAHHRGDVAENCVSNAFKGCSALALSGMRCRDTLHGQVVARPLLDLGKGDLVAVARDCGVPYFKDSTPDWSTRGRLRNELVPLLEEIYGAGTMAHVEQLARDSDALKDLCDAKIFSAFRDATEAHALGARVDLSAFRDESDVFWKTALRDLAESLGRGRLSEKATRVLLGVGINRRSTAGSGDLRTPLSRPNRVRFP